MAKRVGPWHDWFAWHPVQTYDFGWQWCRKLRRRPHKPVRGTRRSVGVDIWLPTDTNRGARDLQGAGVIRAQVPGGEARDKPGVCGMDDGPTTRLGDQPGDRINT